MCSSTGNTPEAAAPIIGATGKKVTMVLVSGFESFNVDLYRQAAQRLSQRLPNVQLKVCACIHDGAAAASLPPLPRTDAPHNRIAVISP